MKKYDTYIFDLDGTLLTDSKEILPVDMAAIERFRAGGGIFTIATGRGYSMARSIAEKLKLDVPAVIFNGAAVYDFKNDRFLWQCEIDKRAYGYVDIIGKAFPEIGAEVLCEQTVYVPYLNETEQTHLDWEQVPAKFCSVSEVPKSSWLKFLFSGEPKLLDEGSLRRGISQAFIGYVRVRFSSSVCPRELTSGRDFVSLYVF